MAKAKIQGTASLVRLKSQVGDECEFYLRGGDKHGLHPDGKIKIVAKFVDTKNKEQEFVWEGTSSEETKGMHKTKTLYSIKFDLKCTKGRKKPKTKAKTASKPRSALVTSWPSTLPSPTKTARRVRPSMTS